MQIKNQKSKIKNVFRNGYVMLLTTIIFMMVSLIIIFGLSTPIIKLIYASRDIWSAKKSYYLAEAGAEDVLYRLKDSVLGSQIVSPEIITLDGYSAVSQISSDVNGRTITTLSDQNGYKKTIETKVTQGSGVSFTYGVQVGQGGIYFNSSGKISGNVLSGGNIVSNNSGASISGSAIVANSPSLIADQTNDSPSTPPSSITFGDTATTQDIAQSFQVSSTSPITQISLYIKKLGAPSDLTVKIVKNSGSAPSTVAGDVVSSAVISSSLVTTNFDWVEVVLSSNPSLVVGATYWIVIDGSTGSASKNYIIGANLDSSYYLGTSKKGVLGGTWQSSTGYDSYFRIFLGGFFGKIIGVGQYNPLHIGTTASDMAWAHDISYVSVTGPLRCQTELLNNKVCDQSFPDPSGAPYPVSDGNIAQWKTDGTAGGSIAGYTNTGSGPVSLGPKKIVGDLHIGGSVTLNMTGTLYVTGNVIVDGSGVIQLASSFGTNGGIIVTDGTVTVSGGGKITNSGQTGSYFLVVTTSNCAGGSTCGGKYAISVGGGGGAVIMNAQKGTIFLDGSVDISEATANLLYLNSNVTVSYKTGVANTNFTSGPSGGFNISGWRELQ